MTDTLFQSSTTTHPISAEAAREIADEYLLLYVGDLLTAGLPETEHKEHWEFPIEISNASGMSPRRVGVIRVDTTTGEVLFSREDAQKVKERARALTRAHASSAGA